MQNTLRILVSDMKNLENKILVLTQPALLRLTLGDATPNVRLNACVLSWDTCVTQLGFMCYSVGIPVVLSWDSCGNQLGFLWYTRVNFRGTHFRRTSAFSAPS